MNAQHAPPRSNRQPLTWRTRHLAAPHIFLLACLLMTTFGCSRTGQKQLDQATNALSANNPSAALVYATQALIKNPNFRGAKQFMRDNADKALAQVNAYLSSTENATDLDVLEKRFDIYTQMVTFYANLETIGLPIVGEKRLLGLIKAWQWTTPIEDYKPKQETARATAREAFYRAGGEAIEQGHLTQAKSRMDMVLTKFAIANSDEQKNDAIQIAKDFVAWASQHHQSTEPEPLLQGIEAFQIALHFNAKEPTAVEGLATMKEELSDVYLAQGLDKKAEDTIPTLKEAVQLFQNALEFNPNNNRATEAIPKTKNRIAVLYCNQGEELERSGRREDLIAAHGNYTEALKWDSGYGRATALQKAVAQNIAESYYQEAVQATSNMSDPQGIAKGLSATQEAVKWVPNYKDSILIQNRFLVAKEVIALDTKQDKTKEDFEQAQKHVTAMSQQVNKAHKGLEDTDFVAGAIIQLDEQIPILEKTCRALSSIPKLGQVLSVIGISLRTLHRPIQPVAQKVKLIRKTTITPALHLVGKTKKQSDQSVESMNLLGDDIRFVNKMLSTLNDTVSKMDDAAVVHAIHQDVQSLNKGFDAVSSSLSGMGDIQTSHGNALRVIGNNLEVVSRGRRDVQNIMRPLDQIKGTTDQIANTLRQKISVKPFGTFTVEQAINSTTGLVSAAAEKLLNPLLKKINIPLPPIPGMEQMEQIMDQMEQYNTQIQAIADNINRSSVKVADSRSELRKTADNIVAKAVPSKRTPTPPKSPAKPRRPIASTNPISMR